MVARALVTGKRTPATRHAIFVAEGACKHGEKCWYKHGDTPGQKRPAGEARAFVRAPPASLAAVALAGLVSCMLPAPVNTYAVPAFPVHSLSNAGDVAGLISLGGAGEQLVDDKAPFYHNFCYCMYCSG